MASRPKNAPSSKARKNNHEAHEGHEARRRPARSLPLRELRALRGAEKSGAKKIEAATEIVPLWVAESVQNEAETFLGTALPADWPAKLAAKAERCFASHRQFHRLVCAPRGGLGNLRRFMRHWLSGLLLRHRPALYRRLPQLFSLGLPLPSRHPAHV